MELWIRSQDGTILEKEERFMIIRGMDVYYIANNGDIYGKYKAKERALEVLDEIQSLLQPTITCDFIMNIEELIEENQELKKQLKEYKHKGLYNTCLPYSTGYNKAIEEKENQQKEFIEYMNKTIEELECEDVDDEEIKGYLIQRGNTFKEILSKYKEIRGNDINVGSMGGKDER